MESEISSNKTIFRKHDLLFGKLRPYLRKAVLAPCDGICSTDILVFRAIDDVLPNFLIYLLHSDSFVQRATSTTSGVQHPRTSWSSLKEFALRIPSLSEQRRIAAILSIVQQAIEQQERLIALTTELKKALMHKLFTEGTRGERQKETEIGLIPESWQSSPMGDLKTTIQSGQTPSRRNRNFFSGHIKWVKTLDLNDSTVFDTEEKLTTDGLLSIRGKLRPIDTVMVAMYGGAGTIGKAGILGVPAATNQAVCCIEPNPLVFDARFLLHYMIYFRPKWMRFAIGTRKDPNISKGTIEQNVIPLPPLAEQIEIGSILETASAKLDQYRKQKEFSTDLFRALLHQLMTAQLRVDDVDLAELGVDEEALVAHQ